MKKRKYLVVGFLLLLALVVSGVTYAYWASLQTTETISVGVGEGVTVSVELDSQTTGTLVPNGVIMREGDVTEVEVEFTVSLDKTDLVSAANLNVEILNKLISGLEDEYDLINIVVTTNPGSIQNSSVIVLITVTMTEPANKDQYDAVAGKTITFDVTFTVDPN